MAATIKTTITTKQTKNTQVHNGKLPMSHGNQLHIPLTNYYLLAVQQEPYKKQKKLKKLLQS